MKIFSLTLILMIFSSISLASDTSLCKIQAHDAAFKTYQAQLPESTFFTKSKFKPIIEGNSIHFAVQILDQDRGSNDVIIVTLDKNSCKVLEIN